MSEPAAAAIVVEALLPPRCSLRVAVVTETYPPEVNGVAATASQVVEGLRQRGHALQLVRPRQDGDNGGGSGSDIGNDSGNGNGNASAAGREPGLAELLMRGLPIPRYPALRMGLPARRALVRHWAAQRPDVVHLVTEGPLGWSALQAAQQLRLPTVSDFRTNFHAYSGHYGVGWLRTPVMAYLRKFHNRCVCTMVPTEGLRRELQAAGFRGLRVVSRGVDAQRFDPAQRSPALRQGWGAGPDTLVALYVGRLAPEKNLGLLLSAVEAMRAVHPRLRLVLVGDGPERARLQQRCPDAVFAGTQRGQALAAHYASADLFLFPSLTETFGNVVPEAMASGLAVLAYDHAAAGQLLRHGANGLLAPPGDEAAFCRLARQLAAEPAHAQGHVHALGRQARQTAQSLDWGRIVEAVEAEYLGAIAAGNPALSIRGAPAQAVASRG